MFEKRHFEAIAATLRESDHGLYVVNECAVILADLFETDNPRFNRERFLAACCPTEREEDDNVPA